MTHNPVLTEEARRAERGWSDPAKGGYTFICDVHPEQMTGDLVVS